MRSRGERAGRLITRWGQGNTAAGYVVFGLLALMAVPALASTVGRFGMWNTLTSAALPALVVLVPLLLWVRYTRRRPLRKLAWASWASVAGLILLTLAASPLWFWTGPVLAVLLSELARTLTGSRVRSARQASPTTAGQQ